VQSSLHIIDSRHFFRQNEYLTLLSYSGIIFRLLHKAVNPSIFEDSFYKISQDSYQNFKIVYPYCLRQYLCLLY
jgi:hypothetical protein